MLAGLQAFTSPISWSISTERAFQVYAICSPTSFLEIGLLIIELYWDIL